MLRLGAVLSVPGVVTAAADAANSGGLDLTQIITAGVTPAVVLLLILTGKLYPSGIVESYKARAEAAEAANALKDEKMLTEVVPALTLAVHALDKLGPMLQTEGRPYVPPPGREPRPSPRYDGR